MTYEEYVKEVRKNFNVGQKPIGEVDKYFKSAEVVKELKSSYKFFNNGPDEMKASCTPIAVANDLDMMY